MLTQSQRQAILILLVIVVVIFSTAIFSSFMQTEHIKELTRELSKYENPIVIKSVVNDKYGRRAVIEDVNGNRAFINCTNTPCIAGDIGKLIIYDDQIIISLDQAPVPPKNLPKPPSPPPAY